MRNSNSPAFAALGSPENGLRTSSARVEEANMTTSTARMDIDSEINARSRSATDDVFWQNISRLPSTTNQEN
jgi:hypothetical protein